ncbi:MAG TPA: hypothetical protein PLQ95_12825, partial [Thiobacillus sp.]|nr:hypothetical protein [Thiobacillus sp.]
MAPEALEIGAIGEKGSVVSDGWRVNNAHVEVESRRAYLYVRTQGALDTVSDVEQVVVIMRDRMVHASLRKLLVDLRQVVIPMPDDACHAAWQFVHGRDYELLACALPEDAGNLMVTRINMTGVSSGLPFRAFANVVDAHRWLDLKPSGLHRRP